MLSCLYLKKFGQLLIMSDGYRCSPHRYAEGDLKNMIKFGLAHYWI